MHDAHDISSSLPKCVCSKERTSPEEQWKATLSKVSKAVVSVKFCHTVSFDAEDASSAEATGFVVDVKNGYILTNRHVAGPNPFWGQCIFENHEEVQVHVIYYDPVHDFGILQYDPKAVKHMAISAIPLRPDMARLAEEVRLVGNDAGEKLSIQSGVISRLDRNAPEYSDSHYNDFNINYMQAALGATGGSSGSPVVNIHGQAVALQAGGKSMAATDFFLPLDRPLRALECLQKGKPITRGTIQCQWKLKPFNECQGLGLTSEWESEFRKTFPKEVGVLVAERVLPQGPSDGKILVGDILVKLDGKLLAQFKNLDEILDSRVGGTIELLLQRRGKDVLVKVEIADLHKITPNRIISVAGGSFQDLSYQRARIRGVACKGVYICKASGSFDALYKGAVIRKVDGEDTPDLDTFIDVMKTIADQKRVVITYIDLGSPQTPKFRILRINRYWSKKITQYLKNDTSGIWDITRLADETAKVTSVPQQGNFVALPNTPGAIAGITKCLVKVECDVPLYLNGSYYDPGPCIGVVIDAEKGVILASRATVFHSMCDITITIADSIVVDGEVIFLHPLHNYALIKYDPALVLAPLQNAKFSSKPVEQGSRLHFVGFVDNKDLQGPMYAKTSVTSVSLLELGRSSTSPANSPMNSEKITIDTGLATNCGSGLLVDDDGIVQALWLVPRGYYNAGYGLPSSTVLPVISKVRKGETLKQRFLGVEFEDITMSQARDLKVSEEWISKVPIANTSYHKLYKVYKRVLQSDDESNVLLEGDIILSLNGNIVTRISELDIADDAEVVDVRVVRYGKETALKVKTLLADDFETKRVVTFCGAVLQPPHYAARLQVGKAPSEVYVSSTFDGSLADHYKLAGASFITQLNDTATCDLDSLLKEAKTIPDDTNFTLTTVTLSGIKKVIKMRKNEHYFPTKEWISSSPKWIQRIQG